MGGRVGMVRVCIDCKGILGGGIGCGCVGMWLSKGIFSRIYFNLVSVTLRKGLLVCYEQLMGR